MRSRIRKELIAKFAPAMQRVLPDFSRCGEERSAGDQIMWAWELAPNLTCFVMLNIADNKDDFAIEVAWSDDGKYPWNNPGFKFTDLDVLKCRDRLSFLWVTRASEFRWVVVRTLTTDEYAAKMAALIAGDLDEVRRIGQPAEVSIDEALPRVAPLVEDAAQKLIDYGIPLFRRVAEQHGIDYP